MESLRVWLLADDHLDAALALKGLILERGAEAVEILDVSEALERMVKDRGEQFIEGLKDIFRRASGKPEEEDEAPEPDEETGAIGDALSRGKPDLIVVTSPRFLKALGWVGRAAGGEALTVALVPDYNLGGAWLGGAVNAFIVPHEDLRPALDEAGVEPQRVFVAGPALPRLYTDAPDAAELREEFGLSSEGGAIAFVDCTRFDSGDLDRMIFQLSLVDQPWQPILHVGEDPEAGEILRRACRTHGLPARLLGAVPNLASFVALSDLVVLPPADDMIVWALGVDRPLLLVGDPGAVTTQRDFLIASGAAMHVGDFLQLGAEAELAVSPDQIAKLGKAAAGVGRRTGTLEVVDALTLIVERRQELEGPSSGPNAEDAGPKFQGPFEMIGAPPSERQSKRPEPVEPATHRGPFESVGGGDSSPPPTRRPSYQPSSPLSSAEAKDQLAALIMQERDLEKRLEEANKAQKKWHNRLELARAHNDEGLAGDAESILRRAIARADKLQEQLQRVLMQKDKLKSRIRKGSGGASGGEPRRSSFPSEPRREPGEGRFRDMEVEDDLKRLRQRLKDEMGD